MKVTLYDPAGHRDKTGILHEKVLLENCPVLNIESRGYAAGTVEHIDRIARQQWRIYRMNRGQRGRPFRVLLLAFYRFGYTS